MLASAIKKSQSQVSILSTGKVIFKNRSEWTCSEKIENTLQGGWQWSGISSFYLFNITLKSLINSFASH